MGRLCNHFFLPQGAKGWYLEDRIEPLDEEAGPQLGDIEAALAALKGSAVLDRAPDTQTVEVMQLMMAVTNAKIAGVRVEL
jgi:hypothetical protein